MVTHSSDEYDELDDIDWDAATCHTCGGDGWLDSVAETTGRWGYDDPRAGTCPNCKGSGFAKDCETF